MEKNINHLYNWSRFYRALCQQGPTLLLGVDEDLNEIIQMSASSTDLFWSEGLEELLAAGAADGDLRAGAQIILCIHTYMSLITKEVLHMAIILTVLVFSFLIAFYKAFLDYHPNRHLDHAILLHYFCVRDFKI